MLVDPRITTRRSCEMEFGEYEGLMNKIGEIVAGSVCTLFDG